MEIYPFVFEIKIFIFTRLNKIYIIKRLYIFYITYEITLKEAIVRYFKVSGREESKTFLNRVV